MDKNSLPFLPYIGLRPFSVFDKDIFFGRLREICQIVNLIYVNQVTLLYSKSGVGKTSLLEAGVIPRLQEDEFEVLPRGRVGGFVPKCISGTEIENIFIFAFLLSSSELTANPTTRLGVSLPKHLRELKCPFDEGVPAPRALIFDQCEELFTTHQDRWVNRQGFFEQVCEALEGDHRLRIVFALREEYLGEMERYAHLLPDGLSARFRLEPLRAADALMAVSDPVKMAGRCFAEGVAEKIVRDLMKMEVLTVKGGTTVVHSQLGEFVEPVQLQVVL